VRLSGFEAGIDKKWDDAKEFYILYTGIIIISVIIIMIPNAPLIPFQYGRKS